MTNSKPDIQQIFYDKETKVLYVLFIEDSIHNPVVSVEIVDGVFVDKMNADGRLIGLEVGNIEALDDNQVIKVLEEHGVPDGRTLRYQLRNITGTLPTSKAPNKSEYNKETNKSKASSQSFKKGKRR